MGTSAFDSLWGEDPPKKAKGKSVAPLHEQRRQSGTFDELWGQEAEPETPKERARGVVQSTYHGITFGLGNKLTAATRAVLPQSMGGTEGFDYQGALTEERSQLDRYRQRHPFASAAGEAVGGVVPALLTAGASLPATLASSARIGAGYGAAYGVGERDNPTLGEAATAAVVGGTVGAATGGVIHGATKAPGIVMDYTGIRPSSAPSAGPVSRLARKAGVETVEERAPQMILERLRRGDLSLEDVMVASSDATRLGKPATLIDLGGNQMARMTRGTQGVPGKGSEQVRSMLEQRRRGAPVRVASDVEQGLGQRRQDTFKTAQELAEKQRARAKPIYDDAMGSPDIALDTPVSLESEGATVTLGDLLKRPSAVKAISYGKQLAAETGEEFSELTAPSVLTDMIGNMPPEALARFQSIAKKQGVNASPSISMSHLHNLKLRLDEMIGYAKANGSLPDGTPATSKMLRAIQDTKNQILTVMDGHAPKYAEARRVWGGDAELQDGLKLGEDFLNSKRPLGELQQEIAELSEAGQEHARIGVVAAIRDAIDKAPDGADVVRRIFGNEAQRQRIRAAFPDENSFALFREQMEMESRMAKNENFVMGGSQTAEKMSDASDIMGQSPPATLSARGVVNAAMRSKMVERLRGMAEQRVDALAPYLTAGGPNRPGAVSGSNVEREEAIARLVAAAKRQQPKNARSHVMSAVGGQVTSGVTRP